MKLKNIHRILNQQAPTLVLLHGYGSNKEDLFGLAPYFSGWNLLCLEAPEPTGMGGFAWYPIRWENTGKIIDPSDVQASAELVSQCISQWVQTEQVQGPLVIGGFSQGAILSMQLLLLNMVADGFVFMSGYALPQWKDTIAVHVQSKDLPIIQTHGTADQVIPFEWAQHTSKQFTDFNRYRFHSYPMGHNLNENCIADIQSFLTQFSG